jgi:hypothetical protein
MNDNENNDDHFDRDDSSSSWKDNSIMIHYFYGRKRSIAEIGDSAVESMRRPVFKWLQDYHKELDELREKQALLKEYEKQQRRKRAHERHMATSRARQKRGREGRSAFSHPGNDTP